MKFCFTSLKQNEYSTEQNAQTFLAPPQLHYFNPLRDELHFWRVSIRWVAVELTSQKSKKCQNLKQTHKYGMQGCVACASASL